MRTTSRTRDIALMRWGGSAIVTRFRILLFSILIYLAGISILLFVLLARLALLPVALVRLALVYHHTRLIIQATGIAIAGLRFPERTDVSPFRFRVLVLLLDEHQTKVRELRILLQLLFLRFSKVDPLRHIMFRYRL